MIGKDLFTSIDGTLEGPTIDTLKPEREAMRTLIIIQAIVAASFLLFGFAMLFALGITGVFIMVPGVIFAVVAGVTMTKTRASAAVALFIDGVSGYFAIKNNYLKMSPDTMLIQLNPGVHNLLEPAPLKDFIVPSVRLLLVMVAFIAVFVDWRAVKSARWF